jgi:hypothetical protein
MSPILSILLERLLWPIPRIRWEVARSLATLISEGHRDAVKGLVQWIAMRNLESEVVLGLSVIDAFDLSKYFNYLELSKAISAPSIASDFLLRRNFKRSKNETQSKHIISPDKPATLPDAERAWFKKYKNAAVPPIFETHLRSFERISGAPFLDRWEHEWCWLQSTYPRPKAEYPRYFSKSDRGRVGQFHVGQREIYISAYLRTLAYFTKCGVMPVNVATSAALLSLAINRSLAKLEAIERPDWTRGVRKASVENNKRIAQRLWINALASVDVGETPIALRVVDSDDTSAVSWNLDMALGPVGFAEGKVDVQSLGGFNVDLVSDDPSFDLELQMAGSLDNSSYPAVIADWPNFLPFGWTHIDIALEFKLASPLIFDKAKILNCSESELRVWDDSKIISRWRHWFADWEPTNIPSFGSAVGYLTTASRTELDKIRTRNGFSTEILVKFKKASRNDSYSEYEVHEDKFWY